MLDADTSQTSFEFISEGPKGRIAKVIRFSEIHIKGVYNLAFGNKNPDTGELDDAVVSNNGDTEKILSTVVETIYIFTDSHPEAWVYAKGSTKSRTRLYRMGITRYLPIIQKDFDLYGEIDDEWLTFEKGVEYESFLAQRRKIA